MKAKRRRHDGAFNARVTLDAMKEEKTIQEIAKDNDVHPTQVTESNKMLVENIAGVKRMVHNFSIMAPICPADSIPHPRSMDFSNFI